MSGGVQKRWLSVKSRIIRSYFEKKPRSRKKSKKVKKRIKLLQYDKKIQLPGEDHTRDGGQGVLAFRALLKSDRFDRAWPMLVPRVKRSKQHWDPPKIAANDDWQILKYA